MTDFYWRDLITNVSSGAAPQGQTAIYLSEDDTVRIPCDACRATSLEDHEENPSAAVKKTKYMKVSEYSSKKTQVKKTSPKNDNKKKAKDESNK
jgi:hypothetical protein